jgi:hypothetical protein
VRIWAALEASGALPTFGGASTWSSALWCCGVCIQAAEVLLAGDRRLIAAVRVVI